MAGSAAQRVLAVRSAPPAISVRLVAAVAMLVAWSSLVLAHPASSWLVGGSQLEPEAIIPISLGVLGLAVGIGLGRPDTWWLGAGVLARFKSKFAPTWVDRDVAFPGSLAAPRVLAALAAVHHRQGRE
jgi:hypothetical protein